MYKIIKEQDLKKLQDENLQLKIEIEKYKKIYDVIDLSIGDPEPTDTEKRKMYVAQVAELYSFFSPKIRTFISRCYKELENVENTGEQDRIIKGAIFAFRELDNWLREISNENFSNNTKINED